MSLPSDGRAAYARAMIKRVLIGLVAAVALIVLIGAATLYMSARKQRAQLDISAVQGTQPKISEPRTGVMPLVNVAKAVGWKPALSSGLGGALVSATSTSPLGKVSSQRG